jgi:hypothetical protein
MCGVKNLSKVVSLTPTPPGNDFLKFEELGRKENLYPLDLFLCLECKHLQLGHVVNPKILYQKNYTYVSATSIQFVTHLKEFAEEMISRFKLNSGMLVADIGSNDGTCLSFFKDKEINVLGIDPATEIAKNASKNGIETIVDFFSQKLAFDLREKYGPVKLITSHNALAHIDNLLDVVKGVEYWLDDDGVFVLEVGYFVDVYQNIWFDTIYHEHLDFHTLAPFERLFERSNLKIIEAKRVKPQGGSIRIMAQKKSGTIPRDSSVDFLINLESQLGLKEEKTFYKFQQKIDKVKLDLQNLLKDLKSKNKIIVGFGAPTKATTLMSHFELNENILDFIVDDNPLKQGLYTPVSHIPIYSADELYIKKPDFVLILAWNFADSIMKKHSKYAIEIGQFILPMPIPQVVD